MAYGIVHTKSYTASAAQGIGREEDRRHLKERNPDIDPERSRLNITKIREPQMTLYQAAKAQLAKMGLELPKKKNQILFEQTVITASPEFFLLHGVSPESLRTCYSPDEMDGTVRNWMEQSEQWALDYFGADNVISMTWHLDETSPHLHVDHLPVVSGEYRVKVYALDCNGGILRNEKGSPVYARDVNGKILYERRQGRKLSRDAYWKARGGRNSYRMMQQSYFEKVSRNFGLERGQQSEETERQHIEQQRYKADRAAMQVKENRSEAAIASAERDLAIRQATEAKTVSKEDAEVLSDMPGRDLRCDLKKSLSGGYRITEPQIDALNRKMQAADHALQEQKRLQEQVAELSDRLIEEENRQIRYVGDKSREAALETMRQKEVLYHAHCWEVLLAVACQLPEAIRTVFDKLVQRVERQCSEILHVHMQ